MDMGIYMVKSGLSDYQVPRENMSLAFGQRKQMLIMLLSGSISGLLDKKTKQENSSCRDISCMESLFVDRISQKMKLTNPVFLLSSEDKNGLQDSAKEDIISLS